MVGIILSVQPSDAKGNWTAENHPQLRGCRHECTVLLASDLGMPDKLMHHVVIPPQRHSGLDNFEEDLPRGCKYYVDGSAYKADFSDVDLTKLDGEWCVVNFLGGNKEYPYIANWWPHPHNNIDPATSGETPIEGTKANLVQADLQKKNRTRELHRVNGVLTLVNREGSVYLDTTEAGRTVKIEGTKRTTSQVDKGGHIQVDVKKKAQLEINWNEKKSKGPRLGAGSDSSSQVHDPDLPHDDQPLSETKPEKRSTKRTLIRSKEWEVLEKTSSYNLWCENTESDGGKKGEASLVCDDTLSLVVAKGSEKVTTINITSGKIQIKNKDGTLINVLADEVQIATSSGYIDIKGGKIQLSGKVDVSGPMAIGGAAGQPTVLATTYLAAELLALQSLSAYFKAVAPVWKAIGALVPPALPIEVTAQQTQQALDAFAAAQATFPTKNLTTS